MTFITKRVERYLHVLERGSLKLKKKKIIKLLFANKPNSQKLDDMI